MRPTNLSFHMVIQRVMMASKRTKLNLWAKKHLHVYGHQFPRQRNMVPIEPNVIPYNTKSRCIKKKNYINHTLPFVRLVTILSSSFFCLWEHVHGLHLSEGGVVIRFLLCVSAVSVCCLHFMSLLA